MALTQSITLNSGVTLDSAYIRIDFYQGMKAQQNICTKIYTDSQSAEQGKPPIDERWDIMPLDLSGANNIAQGYKWLKANIYPDAVDC